MIYLKYWTVPCPVCKQKVSFWGLARWSRNAVIAYVALEHHKDER